MSTPALEARDVAAGYGRRRVLEDVSLRVEPGQVFALLGRNGTGKSTLVRCLLGVQRAERGALTVLGEDPWRKRPALMQRVGVVPEVPDVPPELKLRQVLRFAADVYAGWDSEGVRSRLDRAGIGLDQPFGRLSRGQKSAVMVALATAHSPELLILDDPTLGLDAVARDEVFGELIGQLADRGTSVFLTTHDLRGIEGIADRVAILREGRLTVNEELESLKERWSRSLEEIFTAVTTGAADAPVQP
jgi:ABC-2 type transport system ATP-binding protein